MTLDFERETWVIRRSENARGGKYVLRIETFEVVEVDETFLDLSIESREVILPLKSPSLDTKSPLGLDSMHLIKREWTRMFVVKRCLQWSMREKELVTDTVDFGKE